MRVDVRLAFSSKNPSLARWIPGFAWAWLERFIHQRELNEILEHGKSMTGLEFAQFSLDYLNAKLEVRGFENLPESGPAIVAANHPLGGLDGLALVAAIGQKRPDCKIIVNDLLMAVKPMEKHFIGVNKFGSSARAHLKMLDQEYQSPGILALFPSGMVSRPMGDRIEDQAWTKAFISKAQQYQQSVIPCYIHGFNSPRFYRIARWRKRFGIKANLEMFTLPDEMTKQAGKTIRVQFGAPIAYTQFHSEKNTLEWAAQVRDYVYTLQDGAQPPFP